MSAIYQAWLGDPNGQRLQDLSGLLSVEVVKRDNGVGAWSMYLPDSYRRDLFQKDYMVEIWRSAGEGAQMQWLCAGLIRNFLQKQDGYGQAVLRISGPDVKALLESRIVAYPTGSSQAQKTDQADDMMKALVRENLGSSAVAGRNWSSYGLSVAADLGLGPSITKAFAWRNLLNTLKDVGEAALQEGTGVYFDLKPVALSSGKIGLLFETTINQAGVDRTGQVYFGTTWGNISEPEFEEDYTEEATYIYAGGQGQEDARKVEEVNDAGRLASSIWGRREMFLDTRDTSDTALMKARAEAELSYWRGKKTFKARLVDTERCRFGVEWDFGDRVVCEAFGQEFEGIIHAIKLTMGKGGETLEARIETTN